MSTVHIERCPEYADAAAAAGKALAAVHANRLVKKGSSVLLKVNLIRGASPEKAINTHPEVVRGVGRYFKEHGCRVVVADSSGTTGFTSESFRVSGIQAVCEEEGFELLNFEKSKLKKVKLKGKVLKELYIPEDILNAGLVVSMPKLKTHVLTLFTGSIKNLMGILPGGYKRELHRVGRLPTTLAKALVDIAQFVKPGLSVMDAVLGMEGNGPTGGKPRKLGCIIAGEDPVAVDAVSSYLIGFEVGEVPITKEAYARGLGEMRLERIETNVELDSLRKHFKRPLTVGVLGAVSAYYDSLTKPVIDADCEKCMVCRDECPAHAIYIDASGSLKINYDLCIKCYCCHEKCPHNRVKISCHPLMKLAVKRSLKGYKLEGLK